MPALSQLEAAYQQYRDQPDFQQELQHLLRDYAGVDPEHSYLKDIS